MESALALTMMLLCFLAYMLYTTAWRFTISNASLASLMKLDASASSLCARKSCFVLLSTYLRGWKIPRRRTEATLHLKNSLKILKVKQTAEKDCLLSDVVIWELGPCTVKCTVSRSSRNLR